MSLTPQTLIDNAYLLAYPNVDIGTTVGPGVLLAQLTQLDREVVHMYALVAPERMSTAGTPLTVSGALNRTGYTLTAADFYTDFKWISVDHETFPIRICTEKDFDDSPSHPAGIVRGITFWPADPLRNRWVSDDARRVYVGNGDVIAYRYMTDAPAVTTMAQVLNSPDEAEHYLQWSLVYTVMLLGAATQEQLATAAAHRMEAKNELMLLAAKRSAI